MSCDISDTPHSGKPSGFDEDTVEPRYSELMGGVICSDSEMFGLSKKKNVLMRIQL